MTGPPPLVADGRELISGLVDRVTFHSPDTGFCVLRLQVPGHRELVTVVGHAAAIQAGEHVQASGVWEQDRTHGRQFRAAYLHAAPPTSVEGIEKYLASGLVRGIGPHFAGRLVAAFGAAVLDVIEQEPDRLLDVPGIGPVRASRIVESWRAQRGVRDIMVFLHGHGVGTSRAVRIYKTYGADAIAIISANPYRLARDVRGIGFLSADRMAGTLGIARDAPVRLRAGVRHVLGEAIDDGHCGLPRDEVTERATALLQVPAASVEDAVRQELAEGEIVADTVEDRPCLFLATLAAAERRIAGRLAAMAGGAPPWPAIDAGRATAWVEQRLGLSLAGAQRDALAMALARRALVVTGGPGVGKTTLLRAVLRVLGAKGVRPALCAPTGRAAKRLSEATGVEAKTIHRLLEVDPRTGGFRRGEQSPLEADLVVVDEMSMVDTLLFDALARALPARAALLLVGDADQLPPVGPGQVLADVIASGLVPVVRLTEIFRQAAESRIVVMAHRINRGEMPDLQPAADAPSDFYFVEADDPDEAARKLLQIVKERIPQRFGLDPLRDVQVLCPMNRGALGARALNVALQQLLNPPGPVRVERFGWTFSPGDKVMQVENDYDKDVYNGDIGRVASIDLEASELVADFDGRLVAYDLGELDRLVLAYATTIHKAQGSEYPAVVVPVTTQHYVMLQRNLIYTAVTRGRRLVVLVGQVRALALAVRGRPPVRRWSKLLEHLRAAEA